MPSSAAVQYAGAFEGRLCGPVVVVVGVGLLVVGLEDDALLPPQPATAKADAATATSASMAVGSVRFLMGRTPVIARRLRFSTLPGVSLRQAQLHERTSEGADGRRLMQPHDWKGRR